MLCEICKEFNETPGPFSTGCNTFRLNSIKSHEQSESHEKCWKLFNAKNADPGSSEALVMLLRMNDDVVEKLSRMFRTVHAMAKNGRPFSDFAWQCDLDEAKGLNVSNTYRNDKQAWLFSGYISKVEKKKIENEIQAAKFLSVICDGSVDW